MYGDPLLAVASLCLGHGHAHSILGHTQAKRRISSGDLFELLSRRHFLVLRHAVWMPLLLSQVAQVRV